MTTLIPASAPVACCLVQPMADSLSMQILDFLRHPNNTPLRLVFSHL